MFSRIPASSLLRTDWGAGDKRGPGGGMGLSVRCLLDPEGESGVDECGVQEKVWAGDKDLGVLHLSMIFTTMRSDEWPRERVQIQKEIGLRTFQGDTPLLRAQGDGEGSAEDMRRCSQGGRKEVRNGGSWKPGEGCVQGEGGSGRPKCGLQAGDARSESRSLGEHQGGHSGLDRYSFSGVTEDRNLAEAG